MTKTTNCAQVGDIIQAPKRDGLWVVEEARPAVYGHKIVVRQLGENDAYDPAGKVLTLCQQVTPAYHGELEGMRAGELRVCGKMRRTFERVDEDKGTVVTGPSMGEPVEVPKGMDEAAENFKKGVVSPPVDLPSGEEDEEPKSDEDDPDKDGPQDKDLGDTVEDVLCGSGDEDEEEPEDDTDGEEPETADAEPTLKDD